MNRRSWLIGGAGAAAVAAGLGWRSFSESRRQALVDTTTAGLWHMSFDRPGGEALAMASLRGRPRPRLMFACCQYAATAAASLGS